MAQTELWAGCGMPGESWPAINTALQQGLRGMPGGSSLVKLLEKKRGVRNKGNLPSLTEEQIMEWADAHRARDGKMADEGFWFPC